MEAYKFQIKIPEQRQILIEVPPEAPTGDAEIILLFSHPRQTVQQHDNLELFLDELEAPEQSRSQQDIDVQLVSDRNSWD